MIAGLNRRHGFIASASFLTLAVGAATHGLGGRAPSDGTAPAKPARYLFGPRNCSSCHDQGKPDNRPNYTEQERSGLICRMNEFPIFDQRDKHQFAYAALTGMRARQEMRPPTQDRRPEDGGDA